jgi:hypothetical protein
MAIYAIPEAKHFCSGYRGTSGVAAGSFKDLTGSYKPGQVFAEGSPAFDELRDCSLREAERMLFLAMSLYRRSFSLMTVGTASWAQVTMYYSAFYSAKSLLGMFGGWVIGGKTIIDVSKSTPGAQELVIGRSVSTYKGSHQVFWDHFYANIVVLSPWIDPKWRFAIVPMGGDPAWLIQNRNDVNYDAYKAVDLMLGFQGSFKKSRVATTLPGALNTQFRIMEGLLRLAGRTHAL